jgi:hypothetical protein
MSLALSIDTYEYRKKILNPQKAVIPYTKIQKTKISPYHKLQHAHTPKLHFYIEE